MLVIRDDIKDVKVYLELRKQVGWAELKEQQAELALKNSLKVLVAFDGERPVAMGRVVGDGAVICYIQDLIVIPEYQKKHIGSEILNALTDYVRSIAMEGSTMMLDLMCAKGREKFYEKHGFIARPTETLGPGMIQYIECK